MELKTYNKKRNFKKTKEPKGTKPKESKDKNLTPHPENLLFVIQKHAASHLHYDLRLEMNGVLASWAVPKGPSLDPDEKRLAVHVEDHPLDYANFEGEIPEGEYGGGDVIVWDQGKWSLLSSNSLEEDLKEGKLTFMLRGKKLKGVWSLIKMKGRGKNNWLFFKHKDKYAKTGEEAEITVKKPRSVLSRRDVRTKRKKENA